MTATTNCKSCGAPITWALTAKGRRIPIDPDPGPTGNLLVQDGTATLIPVASREGIDERELYTSHFASCPNAGRHRRSRSAA